MTKLEDLLPRPPVVQFVRPEPEAADKQKADQGKGGKSKGKTISLAQGQSVVLVSDDVAVKVSNTKFHSLVATTYVLVNFLTRVSQEGETQEQKDAHHVEPALVGSAIACNGHTLAVVNDVQSRSKLLKLKLAAGVSVRNDFTE
jgi:hypothetical protein